MIEQSGLAGSGVMVANRLPPTMAGEELVRPITDRTGHQGAVTPAGSRPGTGFTFRLDPCAMRRKFRAGIRSSRSKRGRTIGD